jgi:hypothetical protein
MKIPLDTASYDAGSNLQIANNRYACPVGGYYQVNGLVAGNESSSDTMMASVYVNGAERVRGSHVSTPSQSIAIEVNDIISCNAGDYIELWVYTSTADTIASGALGGPFLSVVKVDVGCRPGAPGVSGTSWKQYTGAGTPSLAAVPGNVGDSCVRTADGEVFQQVGGVWVDQGWSLQGANMNATCVARAWYSLGANTSANTAMKIPLNIVDFDPGNHLIIGSSRYVAPVAGYYQVEGQTMHAATATGLVSVALIYVNGVERSSGVRAPIGDPQNFTSSVVTDILKLNAGDYVELWIYASVSGALYSNHDYNFLAVSLVAATAIQQQPLQVASQARAYRSAALTLTAAAFTKIAIDTVDYDAGGNLAIANGRYVCPAGGYYQVNGVLPVSSGISGGAVIASIYVNGVERSRGGRDVGVGSSQNLTVEASDVIRCNPGDYIELWGYSTTADPVTTGATLGASLSVSLVGTQPTAAPANAARAYRNAALTPAASTWTKVPLDTVSSDAGGNFSIANGRYVCPVAGTYDVIGQTFSAMSATGTYTNYATAIYKNGAMWSYSGPYAAVQQGTSCMVADKIPCNAGDYLELWLFNTQGTALTGTSGSNFMSVSLLTAAPASLPVTTPQVVTTALPSNPVDGQECYFVAEPANGVVWHLKYRAADPSPHKWQFVGGGSVMSYSAASTTTSSTTWVPVAGPSVTVPLPGDYEVENGMAIQAMQATAVNAYGGVAVNGTEAGQSMFFVNAGIYNGASVAGVAQRFLNLPAGAVLTLVGEVAAALSTAFSSGWLKVKPIRLG